jgi:hypothetical protein
MISDVNELTLVFLIVRKRLIDRFSFENRAGMLMIVTVLVVLNRGDRFFSRIFFFNFSYIFSAVQRLILFS